jgi:hypothetical protein
MEMGRDSTQYKLPTTGLPYTALGPLYQQAQTSSPNIQGISDQDVTSLMLELTEYSETHSII